MEQIKIGGLWPAMITPIDRAGNPAVREIEKMVQLFLKQELDGLYILGSTGQGFLLTEAQRMKVSSIVLEIVDGKIPVIAQVGALNTNESVRLAKAAEKAGAWGVSSVGPIYYEVGLERYLEHYRLVGSSINIPFFPYHIGNHSIFQGSAHTYIKSILALPNIMGMKLTTQNLYEISLIHTLSEGRLILFSGADELLCQAALCGTVGAIGSYFNLWGEECKHVREEFVKGNVELGTRFMLAFQEIIFKTVPNVWSFLRKAMLMRYDIDIGIPNPPMGLKHAKWKEQEVQAILDNISKFARVGAQSNID